MAKVRSQSQNCQKVGAGARWQKVGAKSNLSVRAELEPELISPSLNWSRPELELIIGAGTVLLKRFLGAGAVFKNPRSQSQNHFLNSFEPASCKISEAGAVPNLAGSKILGLL